MRDKQGFLLEEAMISVVLCTIVCLITCAVLNLHLKKEENMRMLEEEINQSWEELFAEFHECQACPVEEMQEEETS